MAFAPFVNLVSAADVANDPMDDPAIADLKWIDSTSFATPDEKTFINYRRRNTVTKEEQAADVADDRALIDLKLIDSTGFATEEEKFTNYRRQNTATKEVQDADVALDDRALTDLEWFDKTSFVSEEEKPTNYLRRNTVNKNVQPMEAATNVTNNPMDDPTVAEFKWLDGPNVVIHHRRIAVVASFPTSFGTFTCATNSTNGSPYQDCINTIAAFCQTSSPLFSIWSECHNKVLTVRNNLNTNWKDYVNSCARFAGGDPTSSYCTGNTTRIYTREVYYYLDASGVIRDAYIPKSVTDAIAFIWNT